MTILAAMTKRETKIILKFVNLEVKGFTASMKMMKDNSKTDETMKK
jgi:hypothetical protein